MITSLMGIGIIIDTKEVLPLIPFGYGGILQMGKHVITQGHFCPQFLVFCYALTKQLLILMYV